MKIIYFNSILKTILKDMPENYPTIWIGDFNINMLKETPQSITFQNFMYKYKLKLIFSKSTTINKTYLN